MRGNICRECELEWILVSFNSNRIKIYLSIYSIKEEDKGFRIKEEKIINLGKAQIFMDISSSENSWN